MRIASAKISSKGQVTLPIKLRKELGLDIGSRIDFERLPDGNVGIVPRGRTMADLRGIVKTDRVLSDEELAQAARGAMGGRWARYIEADDAQPDDRS